MSEDRRDNHAFRVEDAEQYGVIPAVILFNLRHWVEFNRDNEKDDHFREGRYWTYNSTKAFKVQYPYLTQRQINHALDKLIDAGIVLKEHFGVNGNKYNRTCWYTVTDVNSILQECEMDSATVANGNTVDVKSLSDTDSYTDTDTKEGSEPIGSTPNGHDKQAKMERVNGVAKEHGTLTLGGAVKPMEPRQNGDPLEVAAEIVFINENPYWENPSRERQAVNKMVAKVYQRWPGNPDEWLKGILATVLRLKRDDQTTKSFWRSMPFLPSQVNSAGKWSMIVEETKASMEELNTPKMEFDLNV